MDKNELERYLFEAEGKDKSELSLENPYREIGFDGEKKRLGWVRNIPFLKIKQQRKIINLLNAIDKLELNINWGQLIDYQHKCLKKG
ncbi:MAG: hypothetical protein KKB76_05300 [Candidatus Omnitrophica bacterium]|nr:hypothetical protein [Candidatus Omnitrophota bacterium]